MTGAEYIVEFLRQRGVTNIFLVTGGACAFIVDAIGRAEGISYTCFQHEQSAAMAADSIWRTNKIVGACVATSGPGVTNLITGIATSFFDSIPVVHIAGQVNQNEGRNYGSAKVRQAGFQETNIVDMVKPITKYAVQVHNIQELKFELNKAYNIALDARMGPVLLDVPMDVQQADAGDFIEFDESLQRFAISMGKTTETSRRIQDFIESGTRPLVLLGAGIGLAGVEKEIENWLVSTNIPFVSSWGGASFFDHTRTNYCGTIGVYGNRGANFLIQNCDRLLVLGSRLDNRQRSGDANSFAKSARVLVIDVDKEELMKYENNSHYEPGMQMDLFFLPEFLKDVEIPLVSIEWLSYWKTMRSTYLGEHTCQVAEIYGALSPYECIKSISGILKDDAIVVADTGATVCWFFQSFIRTNQTIYTSGGNSPMGYSLPAAIGAAIYNPAKQVVAFIGDGGMQMNIQELQTLKHLNLNVTVIIMNNFGYGIIKQFQDSYTDSRYHATGEGYSTPSFQKIANAYEIKYVCISKAEDIQSNVFNFIGPQIIEVVLHPNTAIEPKLEMGRSIEDQFPYIPDVEYDGAMKFGKNARKINTSA